MRLKVMLTVAAVCAAVVSVTGAAAAPPSSVVYDATPSPLPANVASLGYEATSTSEFGDYVHLGGTDRRLKTITVTMSDWALYADYASDARYMGNPATWTHPITVNVYSDHLNGDGVPDTLLASKTETITIPWRPVADPTCPGGTAWRAGDGNCYNGIAFNATFDLGSQKVTLPDDVIVGIAYNTADYGAAPIHQGGPYNSLNVGVPAAQTASVGSDANADNVFWSTSYGPFYADGGAGGVGKFRTDTNWTPNGTVAFQITAGPLCTTVCYVDAATGDDANGGTSASDAMKTIQAAVNQVSPAGTVIVAAGSYAENVAVSKSVTINGAQAGTAVAGRTFGAASESTLTGQVVVTAANVTLDGFSFTGPGLDNGVILKTAANGAVVQNDIFDTYGGVSYPDPVQAVYLENGPDNVTVTGNRISNVQSGGGSAKGVYVGDSTANNTSDATVISNNVISGITGGAAKGGYGIQDNNIVGMTNAVITGNTISGLSGKWAHAIGLERDTPNVSVTFNTISGLTPTTADKIAIWFEDNPSFATGTVNRNSLAVGGAAYGIAVAGGSGTVDGTCNWWGALDGPGPIGSGSGSLVGPNIAFGGWLASSDLNGLCAGGTALNMKQSVLIDIQGQGPVNKDTDKKIADAISHLTKSVNNGAWSADGNHLSDVKGADAVFNEEKEAVKALKSIKSPSSALAASIASWQNSLAGADRLLATTAIADGGSAADLNKANTELGKGDTDRANGKYDTAIDHYKNAWKALN
jgi:hypothetical protein